MRDNKKLQLEERRFDADSETLGEWEFAREFPKLALACLENEEMEKALEVDAPQVTHGRRFSAPAPTGLRASSRAARGPERESILVEAYEAELVVLFRRGAAFHREALGFTGILR